jgi:hypothetical protein
MGLFLVLFLAILLLIALKVFVRRYVKFYRCVAVPDHIPTRPTSIKLLVYNLSSPPNSGVPLVGGSSSYRLNSILAELKDYDVVALQSAYQSGTRAITKFIQSARETFPYIASGPVPPFASVKIQDSGLFILSKYPIITNDIVTYSTGSKVTAGAIYAKIRFSPFENAHFIVTEFEATSPQVRSSQLSAALALIKKHVTDRFAVFLLGEFNLDRDYQDFVQNLTVDHTDPIDLAATVKSGEVPAPIAKQGFFYFKPQPEDYVFAKATASVATFKVDSHATKSESRAGLEVTVDLVKLVD